MDKTNAKPILFNTEMVRAILDGRKTVTRRVIKDQPYDSTLETAGDFALCDKRAFYTDEQNYCSIQQVKSRYQIGDILYVREAWGIGGFNPCGNEMFVEYKADLASATIVFTDKKFNKYYDSINGSEPDFRPSIHMPKEAARIFLKVTGVRAERLQDIASVDIEAEGVDVEDLNTGMEYRYAFECLWNSTIKKSDIDKYGWQANPWVWVIEFERVSE